MAGIPRAQRFPIEVRVRCRPQGRKDWSEGTSLNVSRTGVLFTIDRVLPAGMPVEIILELSWTTDEEIINELSPATAEAAADILCSGRIVRADYEPPLTATPALAATIESYSFLREH